MEEQQLVPLWPGALDLTLTHISPKPCALVPEKFIKVLGRSWAGLLRPWNTCSFLHPAHVLRLEGLRSQGSGSAEMPPGSNGPITSHFSHSGHGCQRRQQAMLFFLLHGYLNTSHTNFTPLSAYVNPTTWKVRRTWKRTIRKNVDPAAHKHS